MAWNRNSRSYGEETAQLPDAMETTTTTTTSTSSTTSSFRSRHSSLSSGRHSYNLRDAEEGRCQNANGGSDITEASSVTSENGENPDPFRIGPSLLVLTPQMSHPDPDMFPDAPADGRPANFGVVIPGVYRSGYPTKDDFSYLQGLELKTVVTLVKKDELDDGLGEFATENGINQIIFNIKGTKKEAIAPSAMRMILEVVLNPNNYPLLIHCNRGKHRTGCVVASMRMTAGWENHHALSEYRAYAEPKVRDCDVEYITNLDASLVRPRLLPLPPMPGAMAVGNNDQPRLAVTQTRGIKRAVTFGLIVLVCLISGHRFMAGSSLRVP
ncbi:hypothetical protein GMORB2_4632 [Geosmithia morbida]|uniref:diphosphoinositol-polyphosphate diphosphatase n=1 Tax=Geosmithia morbida TaxID=1094350 RepID=A0A9P4YN42_9HYPO|nr:uncharacterized protein GMORB2_4632 [Geosmithia morbida]KAF4119502.1 hypothetical protein GMORB2_4632 [Geosmithia morbida]